MRVVLFSSASPLCRWLAQTVRRSARATAKASFRCSTGRRAVSVSPLLKQAATAADAASQRRPQPSAVIAAIRQLLGPDADVKTSSYSLIANDL